MQRPKIYNSELLLENLIESNNTNNLIRYIRSLNKYIDYLERHVDLDELDITTNETMEEDDEDCS